MVNVTAALILNAQEENRRKVAADKARVANVCLFDSFGQVETLSEALRPCMQCPYASDMISVRCVLAVQTASNAAAIRSIEG